MNHPENFNPSQAGRVAVILEKENIEMTATTKNISNEMVASSGKASDSVKDAKVSRTPVQVAGDKGTASGVAFNAKHGENANASNSDMTTAFIKAYNEHGGTKAMHEEYDAFHRAFSLALGDYAHHANHFVYGNMSDIVRVHDGRKILAKKNITLDLIPSELVRNGATVEKLAELSKTKAGTDTVREVATEFNNKNATKGKRTTLGSVMTSKDVGVRQPKATVKSDSKKAEERIIKLISGLTANGQKKVAATLIKAFPKLFASPTS